jgi:peptidoglycan/LPS O-acetylase OafA/YrhL
MIWLAGVIIAGVEYIVRSKTDSDFLLLRYFPCFLAGVFAWRLITTKKRLLPGWLLVLFLMTLVTLYRLEDVLRVYGPNWHSALHGALRNDHQIWLPMYLDLVRDWVFCGITGLAVPFFADIKLRFLNASTKKIAQYSYGIYLCHVPMMWFCFRILHLGNAAVSAVLCVFLTALTSFLLYHSIEQPAIRLGKHLSTRLVNGIAFT